MAAQVKTTVQVQVQGQQTQAQAPERGDAASAEVRQFSLLEILAVWADAGLFVSIAALALAGSAVEHGRPGLRLLGLTVAAVTLARAIASPLGLSALDVVAPVAFLCLVLFLSVRPLCAQPVPA